MTNWPEKKEVPERIDTSGWSNIGDIEDANSDRYCNMSYNQAQEECSKVALEKLEKLKESPIYCSCCEEIISGINALIEEIKSKNQ